MSRYLRYTDYINEAKTDLHTNTISIVSGLTKQQKEFINKEGLGLFKNVIKKITNSGWIVTFYPGVIKVRDSMNSSVPGFKFASGKLEKDLPNLLKNNISNKFTKGLLLVYYLMLNNQEDRILFNPKDSLKQEKIAIEGLNKKLKSIIDETGPITISVKDGNKKIHFPVYQAQAIEVDNISGRPRADFALIDTDGSPVLYISHKDGTTLSGFQQYSGMLEDKNINVHEEVQEFVSNIKKHFDTINDARVLAGENPISMTDMPSGTYWATPITATPNGYNLVGLSLFGREFGSADFNKHNCGVIFQGEILLEPTQTDKAGTIIAMSGSGHTIINPYLINKSANGIDIDPSSPYWPALVCIKSSSANQFGLAGSRFYIWPQGHAHIQRGVTAYNDLTNGLK